MIELAKRLLNQHSRSGVLIDANLLFLLVLGSVDRRQISVAKKARQFTEADFDLLVAMFDRIQRLVVTAYVATEVSNLATSLNDHHRHQFLAQLRALLANQSAERHIPVRLIVELDEFEDFGAADTAILRVSRNPPLVLTTDWPLANKLETLGRPVINFNHIRGARLGVYTP